jgi:hypothetical protein
MGYHRETFVSGKYREHDAVEGEPIVVIYTFRKTSEGVVQDTLRLTTAWPPTLGTLVQGFDGEYTKVEKVEISYQIESPPIIYVTCAYPKSDDLRC